MTRFICIALLTLGYASWATADAAPEIAPISIHARAHELHRDAPTTPELIGDLNVPLIPLQPRGQVNAGHPCHKVFGYLPYWESSANLRYDHLTHLAAFSVEVNSNGTLGNDHGWPWTSVINSAHAAGTKVVLVVTLFDNSAITTLINNPTYKQNFFTNIKNKMLEGTSDGINIDFEPGGSGSQGWQSQMHTFMADLTNYMHTQVPGSEVTLAGPAVNWSSRWDLPAVADSCDGIFIMGYAFAGSFSSSTWANSPLDGGSYDITNTVLTQYAGADPAKLILGVPYYGHDWRTSSSAAYASITSFISSTRFRDNAVDALAYGRLWDANTSTPWYRWHDGTSWRQVWYDDEVSLGLKYDLALDHNFSGVGMWALNYDGARDELWELIETKIGVCDVVADFDNNGHIDFTDFLYVTFCIAGPDSGYPEGHLCRTGDGDGDTDMDMLDFVSFQTTFGQ